MSRFGEVFGCCLWHGQKTGLLLGNLLGGILGLLID